MPYRVVVSNQLAKLFGVLSHPMRIRIIEELKLKDLTVSELKDIVGATHAAVSQQLAVMRNCGLVSESRQGRNVYYHLRQPELATWIMNGLGFISPNRDELENMTEAINLARSAWGADELAPAKNRKSGKKA